MTLLSVSKNTDRWDTQPVTTSDPLDEELSHRRTAPGENRIPPALAVLLAYSALTKPAVRGTDSTYVPGPEAADQPLGHGVQRAA